MFVNTRKQSYKSANKIILRDCKPVAFHWKPDRPDPRDYLYQATNKTIAPKVDLRNFCSPIEDQGNLGSCTGQAIAGAIEYLYYRANNKNDISRLYIYYYERALLGTINYDSGAYIRDGIKVISKNGAPIEKLWPYVISKYQVKPTFAADTDAARRKVTLYERALSFNACIDALNNGFPVTIGFYVYSSFMNKSVSTTGMMPYPNVTRESLLGGHAVLLVGYDNATQRFIARNSWGSKWGDKGYFYMPYQVIQNTAMSQDFWVVKKVTIPTL